MIYRYHIKHLDCADCALNIETHLKSVKNFQSAELNFAALTLTVDTDYPEKIRDEVSVVDPDVELIPLTSATVQEFAEDVEDFRVKQKMLIIIISGVLFLSIFFLEGILQQVRYGLIILYIIAISAYLLAGWNVLRGAVRTIVRGIFFDENVLMSLATVGAIAIGALTEAVGVMIFFKVGEFLQNLAVHRSRRSIKSLLAVRPNLAHVVREGREVRISPEEVKVGEVVNIRPGEKIPLDGTVVSGVSHIDTSALTGEPRPNKVQQGQSVLAGEINLTNLIVVEVTKPFSQSSIVRLLEEVENAASRKAKTEKFISRIARYYTPFVVAVAALIAFIPPLVFPEEMFSAWIYRALVILVISCPCALVISIPLGFFGGIGGASKKGILVKGSHFLERLSNVKIVVFDKTGTLTHGVFSVQQVVTFKGTDELELLEYAGASEYYSNHPIALSVKKELKARGVDISQEHIEQHSEIAGRGVKVRYKGREILSGNHTLMRETGIEVNEEQGTIVYVSLNGKCIGYIRLGDKVKDHTFEAMAKLRESGVEQIWMLTGDNKTAAMEVASKTGIDRFESSLLPVQKVEFLEKIVQENPQVQVAFVGDGINDAPVLARADVGIAMGTLGSDAAIETADVVVTGDSPLKVAEAINIAKFTKVIVWQNIIISLGVKLLFVSLGAFGVASMWEAVFADMGMAIVAILNAGRVLKS
ncbi:heavy metal translocating P-type ATPase [Chitinispirillales bacterium ANBcel5]|uniref:heavy metal translocating P-type ATPase n=1 Tax=Cellulosispirillum alkaliphilum TaxID=3039283 RepID=UPI002A544BDA|nr:heavy metal translocating P-type ATPase [Chitinispirillales bacterium ANBcel5]